MNPINDILQEIKNKCDIDTYTYLESFITVKLKGYKLEKKKLELLNMSSRKMKNGSKCFL